MTVTRIKPSGVQYNRGVDFENCGCLKRIDPTCFAAKLSHSPSFLPITYNYPYPAAATLAPPSPPAMVLPLVTSQCSSITEVEPQSECDDLPKQLRFPTPASFITESSSNKTTTNEPQPSTRTPRAAYLLPLALRSVKSGFTSSKSEGRLTHGGNDDSDADTSEHRNSPNPLRQHSLRNTPLKIARAKNSCFFAHNNSDDEAATEHRHTEVSTGTDDDSATRRGMSRWRSASSANKLAASRSLPDVSPASPEEDNEARRRANFARSRNNAKKWQEAGQPPDAIDAFANALPAARDTRALARTLRSIVTTLPRSIAAVHRDTLDRATNLAVTAALEAPTTSPPPHAPFVVGNGRRQPGTLAFAANCTFGDALALAAVTAASQGRISVRKRVRRGPKKRWTASFSLKETVGGINVRLDIAEREVGRELIDIVLVCIDKAAPFSSRRRDAFGALAERFNRAWNELGVPMASLPVASPGSSRGWRRQVSFSIQ